MSVSRKVSGMALSESRAKFLNHGETARKPPLRVTPTGQGGNAVPRTGKSGSVAAASAPGNDAEAGERTASAACSAAPADARDRLGMIGAQHPLNPVARPDRGMNIAFNSATAMEESEI